MPNSIVQFYRKKYPNDQRTDDEITIQYVEDHGLDKFKAVPDFLADVARIELRARKANAPGLGNEFTKAFGSGVDMAQAKLYDTAALAGEIVGSEGLTQFGDEGYKRNLAESALNAPTIQSVGEIGGVGDAIRYGVGLAGQQAPQILGTVGGGLAGFAVAGLPGAAIGAGGVGFTQMQNRGELRATPGAENVVPTALGVGAIGAALESLPVTKALGKLMPSLFGKMAQEVGEEQAKKLSELYLTRVMKDVPVQAVYEASTEVAQEIVSMTGEHFAHRNDPNFTIPPDQVRNRIINAGAAGGLLGGGIGALTAIPGPRQPAVDETGQQQTGSRAQTTTPAVNEPLAPGQAPVDPRLAITGEAALSGILPDDDTLDVFQAVIEAERQRAAATSPEGIEMAPPAVAPQRYGPLMETVEEAMRRLGLDSKDDLGIVGVTNELISLKKPTNGSAPPAAPVSPEIPSDQIPVVAPEVPTVAQVATVPPPVVAGPAPVMYRGQMGPLHLYDLTEEIPGHPKGSTVSENTLLEAGLTIPDGMPSSQEPLSVQQTDIQKQQAQENVYQNDIQNLPAVTAPVVDAPPGPDIAAIPPTAAEFRASDLVDLIDIADTTPALGTAFNVDLPKTVEQLKQTLVLGARADHRKNSNLAATKRATFFLDAQSGKVWMLGTFQNTRGEVMVVNPDPDTAFTEKQKSGVNRRVKRKARNLESVLEEGRFVPVASARLNGAMEQMRFVFTTDQFKQMTDGVQFAMSRDATEIARAEEIARLKMQTVGKEAAQEFFQQADALTSDEVTAEASKPEQASDISGDTADDTRVVRFKPEFLYDLFDEIDAIADRGELTPDMVRTVLTEMAETSVGLKHLRENIGVHPSAWVANQFLPGVVQAYNENRNTKDDTKRADAFRRSIARMGEESLRENLESGSRLSTPTPLK